MKYSLTAITVLLLFFASCKQQPNDPAAIIVTGDSLTNPNVQPKVIATTPGANGSGPYEGMYDRSNTYYNGYYPKPHLMIQFNKLIDLASIGSSSVTVRSSEGVVYTTSIWTSTQNQSKYTNIVLLRINGDGYNNSYPLNYTVGKRYTVLIDSAIADIHGYHLSRSYSFSYIPEPSFRVISFSPEGSRIPVANTGSFAPTERFVLRMNSFVDTSFARAVTILPAVNGKWKFVFDLDSSILIFNSAESLRFGMQYVVAVDSSANDSYGHRLGTAHHYSFTTEQFAMTNVSTSSIGSELSYLEFHFNARLDTAFVRSAFTVTPATTGIISYPQEQYMSNRFHILRFTPNAPLLLGTQYQFGFSTSLRTQRGERLPLPATYAYTSPALSGYIDIGGYPAAPNAQITMIFSYDIDTSTVRRGIRISPQTEYSFQPMYSSTSKLVFIPKTLWKPGTLYTVIMDTSLKALRGGSFSEPQISFFSITPFQSVSAYPYDGATGVNRLTSISINTNLPIDSTTVKNAFSISPSVSGTFTMYPGMTSPAFMFTPGTQLQANTKYTVTVSNSLSSLYGDLMTTPYIFTFTTSY